MTPGALAAFGWIAGVLVGLPLACGDHDQRTGTAPQPIVGAVTDSGDEAVVGLVYAVGTQHVINCTGTLVDAKWVLTAGHCVAPSAPHSVLIGHSLATGRAVPVQRTVLHTDYGADDLRADLALLELVESPDIEPIVLTRDAPTPNTEVRVVGFGRGDQAEAPRKRTGYSRVSDSDAEGFAVIPSPSLACSGDSGGPALLDRGHTTFLVGVLSKGDWDCAHHASYVQGAVAAAFVDLELARASAHESPASCQLAHSHSAPLGSWAAVLAALGGIWRRANRRRKHED